MKYPALLTGLFALLAALLPASRAHAFIELNAFYFSDTMAADSSASSNRMFVEGTLGFMIDKKGEYLVGWAYGMFNATDTTTSSITYASTQMGPRFVWVIDKAKNWSLGLGYYLVTSATYNAGTEEKWKGSAIKADAGYNFNVTDRFQMGVRLNYSAATYTEKLVGATTYSEVSYTRSFIYPSLYSMYLF